MTMPLQKMRLVMYLLMSIYVRNAARALPVSDSFVNEKLDSANLIKMGNTLDRPILRLLGLTIRSVEETLTKSFSDDLAEVKAEMKEEREELKAEVCKLNSCTEWTVWSECSAKRTKTFGEQNRSRNCGVSSDICVTSKVETEINKRICEGEGNGCPNGYTRTTNKFCIKYENVTTKSWSEASAQCVKDGGHLINIDSELKASDLSRTLESMNLPDYTYFWIDGKSSPSDTSWTYEYGSDNTGLTVWYSGHPKLSHECLIFYKLKGVWYLYGISCSGKRHYMCEII